MIGELGPEARGILDAGRDGDDPTPADRARLRSSVMQAVVVGGGVATALGAAGKASASVAPKAAAGAAAAAKTVSGFGLATKVVAVLAVASAVGGGGYAWTQQRGGGVSASMAGSVIAPVAARASAPVLAGAAPRSEDVHEADATSPPDGARPSSDGAPVAAAAPQAVVAPPRARVAPATPGAPAEVDPLQVETRELSAAHKAMEGGDAARALEMIDEQARTHGGGQLAEERAAERVVVLCKLGRQTEGKSAAARFVAEHPRSPLVDRVQKACSTP